MNNRIGLFLLLIFAFACSRKVAVTDPNFVENNKLVFQTPEFEYLNTKTKIQYKDAENSVSTSATIRIKKDSIIWMSLSPILGIEAARALITQDSMVLMNRLNKEYTVYHFKLLSEKFHFDITYQLIQSMILGNMPMEAQAENEIISSKQYYIVKQQNGPYAIENYISRELMKLKKVQMMEVPTKNSLTLEYENYKPLAAFSIPFNSFISFNYENGTELKSTEINIKHGRAELASALRFPFEIPSRYERK